MDAQALSYPVVLTQAEMAVMLSLVGAQTLQGLEHAALFPENEAVWESLFLKGRAELERDKWLNQIPGTVQYHLNDDLVAVIAAMAGPRAVLVTILESPGRPKQSVAHYVADVVVEACYDGNSYQVAALSSIDVMLARLANTLGLPQQRTAVRDFELSAEQARQAVADPRPETLMRLGVPTVSVNAFAMAIRGDRQRVSLQVMHVVYGQVTTIYRLQVLLASEGFAWLAIPENSLRVRFLPVSATDFVETVHRLIPEG